MHQKLEPERPAPAPVTSLVVSRAPPALDLASLLADRIAAAVWSQIEEQAFSSWRCPPNPELADTARFDLLLGLLWIALAEELGEREGHEAWGIVLRTFAGTHMEADLEEGAEGAFFEAAELLRRHWQVAPEGDPLEAALRITARDAYLLPDGPSREATLRAVVQDLFDDAARFLADIHGLISSPHDEVVTQRASR